MRDMFSMLGSTVCALCMGYMAGLGNRTSAVGIGRGRTALGHTPSAYCCKLVETQ